MMMMTTATRMPISSSFLVGGFLMGLLVCSGWCFYGVISAAGLSTLLASVFILFWYARFKARDSNYL